MDRMSCSVSGGECDVAQAPMAAACIVAGEVGLVGETPVDCDQKRMYVRIPLGANVR